MINNIISHSELYNSFLTEIYSTPICNYIYYTTDIIIFSKHDYFYMGTSVNGSPALANALQISQDIITSKSKYVSVTSRIYDMVDRLHDFFTKHPAPEVLEEDNKAWFSNNTKKYIFHTFLALIWICVVAGSVYNTIDPATMPETFNNLPIAPTGHEQGPQWIWVLYAFFCIAIVHSFYQ